MIRELGVFSIRGKGVLMLGLITPPTYSRPYWSYRGSRSYMRGSKRSYKQLLTPMILQVGTRAPLLACPYLELQGNANWAIVPPISQSQPN